MSNAGFKAVFADENNKELVIMSVKRAFPRTNLQFSPFEPQSTKVPFANRNPKITVHAKPCHRTLYAMYARTVRPK